MINKVTKEKAAKMLATSQEYYDGNPVYLNYASLLAAKELMSKGRTTINGNTWVVA